MKIILPMIIATASLFVYMWIDSGKSMKNTAVSQVNKAVEQAVSEQVPISIEHMRKQKFGERSVTVEEDLGAGSNYHQYIASYVSEGNRIYGLLTVPEGPMPEGGWPAIVFNHGYIPPKEYVTTERYGAYVDYLAKSGFVVFKIDFRGHGRSDGTATGSYFSPGYTIDAINALRALQKFDRVNPGRIGMWGHSMSGNVTLRALEVTPEIRAGVIWAGAVYSYADMAKYAISDRSYIRRTFPSPGLQPAELQKIRTDPKSIDFGSPLWKSISLTANLKYLQRPVQIHHSVDDETVNVGYSRDLAAALKEAGKKYEYFEYEGGGHNISSPYFETAMERTVQFFRENL